MEGSEDARLGMPPGEVVGQGNSRQVGMGVCEGKEQRHGVQIVRE